MIATAGGVATLVAPVRFGLVADDLTGALDAAAGFAHRGLACDVVPASAPVVSSGSGTSDAPVIVRCTGTRDGHAGSAERLRDFLPHLASAGVAGVKIDSALRGCPGADLAVVVHGLPGRSVVLAPAFPQQGRTTRDGRVLVHGRELDAAGFHAGGCVPTVHDVAAEVGLPVRHLCVSELRETGAEASVRAAMADGPVTLTVDIETTDDLERLVALGVASGSPLLWVGSAGLFTALAATAVPSDESGADGDATSSGSEASHASDRAGRPRRVLVASGSASAPAVRQLAALEATGVETVRLRASGHQDTDVQRLIGALEDRFVAAVCAEPAEVGGILDGVPAARVAETVGAVGGRFDALVVIGGDTAEKAFAALGTTRLRVESAFGSGIAVGRTDGQHTIDFVSKAGSFGDDTTLITAVAQVRQRTGGTP